MYNFNNFEDWIHLFHIILFTHNNGDIYVKYDKVNDSYNKTRTRYNSDLNLYAKCTLYGELYLAIFSWAVHRVHGVRRASSACICQARGHGVTGCRVPSDGAGQKSASQTAVGTRPAESPLSPCHVAAILRV